jgi:hypothetical protein
MEHKIYSQLNQQLYQKINENMKIIQELNEENTKLRKIIINNDNTISILNEYECVLSSTDMADPTDLEKDTRVTYCSVPCDAEVKSTGPLLSKKSKNGKTCKNSNKIHKERKGKCQYCGTMMYKTNIKRHIEQSCKKVREIQNE